MLNNEIQLLKSKIEHDGLVISVQKLKDDINILQCKNKDLEERLCEIEQDSDDESDDSKIYNDETVFDHQEISSKFKCDICEFECLKKITLEKHKNTRHSELSILGPGKFGCVISVREGKEPEAEIMRQTWNENNDTTNDASVEDSQTKPDKSVKYNEDQDINGDLIDEEKIAQFLKFLEDYSPN